MYATIYIAAATASAAALYALGWQHSLAEGALACAVVALLTTALAGGAAALSLVGPRRSAWHRRRALSVRDRSASISDVWPLAFAGWLVLHLLEHAHTLRAESLS